MNIIEVYLAGSYVNSFAKKLFDSLKIPPLSGTEYNTRYLHPERDYTSRERNEPGLHAFTDSRSFTSHRSYTIPDTVTHQTIRVSEEQLNRLSTVENMFTSLSSPDRFSEPRFISFNEPCVIRLSNGDIIRSDSFQIERMY